MHHFTCNICNSPGSAEVLDRELPTCARCGSNVRFRWIVHALSLELFGKSLPLTQFPVNKAVHGLGMSDWLPMEKALTSRLSYRNTVYHREPRFDIMSPPPGLQLDFIISSDVFEHVEPPIQKAFDNLLSLLKPGGFALFSCPWEQEGETIEHFPNLYDWKLAELRSSYVLVNRTRDSHIETFDELNFHGGPGSTLEMRIFSKEGLLSNCRAAGFEEPVFAEDYAPWGIVAEEWSRGLVLRKPL